MKMKISRALAFLLLLTALGCSQADRFEGMELDAKKGDMFVMAPPIRQTGQFKCGFAVLSSLAVYHGVSPAGILGNEKLVGYQTKSLSAKDLAQMGENLGLIAFAYQGTMQDLKTNLGKGRPVAVLLKHSPKVGSYPSFDWAVETSNSFFPTAHWVLVVGFKQNDKIVIFDPKKGFLLLHEKTFSSLWNAKSRICVLVCRRQVKPPTVGE